MCPPFAPEKGVRGPPRPGRRPPPRLAGRTPGRPRARPPAGGRLLVIGLLGSLAFGSTLALVVAGSDILRTAPSARRPYVAEGPTGPVIVGPEPGYGEGRSQPPDGRPMTPSPTPSPPQ